MNNGRWYSLRYWMARVFINGLAVLAFKLSTYLIGVQFSTWLYGCACVVYIVLSLGDTVIDEVFPPGKIVVD